MRASRIAALAATFASISGCAGGGGGTLPGLPPPAPALRGGTVVGATVALPVAAAHAPGQIAVVGALYPSYVSSTIGNNTQILTPKGKILSAKIGFTGVPRANNEWAVVAFYKYAPNGSTVYVGTEAALVNVDKPTVNVAVDEKSTQIFQATMSLIGAGLITAQDLSDQPDLPAAIAADAKRAGLTPNASTGLYTPQQLQQFVLTETPKWQRLLTIDAGPTARVISVANDLKLASEGFLSNNTRNFLGALAGSQSRPAGAPCGNTVPAHVPGTSPTPSPISCATIYGTSGGKLTIPVYGNAVVVGASNGRIPYTGDVLNLPYRAPGKSAKLTFAKLPSTQIDVKTSDPFDWAFGSPPSVVVQLSASAGAQPFALVENYYPGWGFSKTLPVQYGVPAGYSAKNPNIAVNGWNPFNVPNANFAFCTSWNICQPLVDKKTFAIDPPFADPGTDLKYFLWKGTGGTTVAAVKNCPGYVVTPKKGSSTSTFVSKTPTLLLQSQQLTFHFNAGPGCGGVPSPGSTVAVTAVGGDGVTFSGRGASSAANPHAVTVAMDTFLPLVAVKQTTITIVQSQTPGAIGLATIASPFTP
ncbi:MAG TPA: hypothetical protein VMF61_10525 [Candidatus Acidoferrales bacterium]|nr:hypothetical protein [Candidatus Acidoferrales bacterium]